MSVLDPITDIEVRAIEDCQRLEKIQQEKIRQQHLRMMKNSVYGGYGYGGIAIQNPNKTFNLMTHDL